MHGKFHLLNMTMRRFAWSLRSCSSLSLILAALLLASGQQECTAFEFLQDLPTNGQQVAAIESCGAVNVTGDP